MILVTCLKENGMVEGADKLSDVEIGGPTERHSIVVVVVCRICKCSLQVHRGSLFQLGPMSANSSANSCNLHQDSDRRKLNSPTTSKKTRSSNTAEK